MTASIASRLAWTRSRSVSASTRGTLGVHLPDTVSPLEVGWTIVNAAALVVSARVWLWARADLAYVRRSKRRHLARSFREDVRNARGRALTSVALMAAGIAAMLQPQVTPRPTVAGWIITLLLFAAPAQIIHRGFTEASTRREIVLDVVVEIRNGNGEEHDEET